MYSLLYQPEKKKSACYLQFHNFENNCRSFPQTIKFMKASSLFVSAPHIKIIEKKFTINLKDEKQLY